jgi:hypothetical protein
MRGDGRLHRRGAEGAENSAGRDGKSVEAWALTPVCGGG